MIIEVNETIKLVLIEQKHSHELYQLVLANRLYLRKWLPWVDYMETEAFILNFINGSTQRMISGLEYAFVILKNDTIVGRIGIYKIDYQNKTAEIGYWLGESYQNEGVVTLSCKALIQYCFDTLAFNRIEIRCAVENYLSQRIPERLGFKMEGILRQGEWLHLRFTDLKLYSILKEEWKR